MKYELLWITDIPRTNNSCEGWHNAIHGAIGCDHPSINRFIEFLKNEQKLHEFTVAQASSGMNHSQKKKKYREFDERLKKTLVDYNKNKGDLKKLVMALASNINYAKWKSIIVFAFVFKLFSRY